MTRSRPTLRLVAQVLVVAAVTLLVLSQSIRGTAQSAPGTPGPVYIVDISGTIDLGLAPYLERVLDDAEADDASVVVIRINTPGGRLDAVLEMRDILLDTPVPTVAFVDSTAFSAGALVALASEEIYMSPGAVMGAATPVLGGTGEVADAKTVSAVRSTFEATAELRGRDPLVAAAMVDPDVEVDGLIEEGQLLTLTATQALEVGYAEGVVPTLDALLDELGLGEAELIDTSPGLAEQLVRWLTNPVVASLLLSVGVLALIADLASGGIGLGVVVGIGLLGAFFWGHMLAGLAGWEDAALVVLGLALIAVEFFVIPGFGVAGILGLASLLGGAFLAMLNRDWDFVTTADIVRVGLSLTLVFVAVVAGTAIVLTALSRNGSRSGLVLQARLGSTAPVTERARGGWMRWFGGGPRLAQDERRGVRRAGVTTPSPDEPAVSNDPRGIGPSLLGATGTALSDLRPSGIADIDGRRVDVVTSGEYLPRGEAIEVMSDEGYRRVVRRRSQ